MGLTHSNPPSMHSNPAFSQGVLLEGPGRLLVVGGQNGVDANGHVVSPDFAEQTRQAMVNLRKVLAEAGAGPQDVAKLTIYLAAGQDARMGFQASYEVWGAVPTAITVVQVPGYSRPDVVVEVEALALVPMGAG